MAWTKVKIAVGVGVAALVAYQSYQNIRQRQQLASVQEHLQQAKQEAEAQQATITKLEQEKLVESEARRKTELAASKFLASQKVKSGALNSTLESERAEKERLTALQTIQGSLNEALVEALREGATNLPGSLTEALTEMASVMKAGATLRGEFPNGAPAEGTPQREQYLAEYNELMKRLALVMADKHLEEVSRARDPTLTARSQLWVMADVLNMDERQIQQADQILQQNYRNFYGRGLDRESRPETGIEAWDKERAELSARAYEQIKAVMNSEQQRLMGSSFGNDFIFTFKIQFPAVR